ncbi:MAG: hypothetical protein LBR55_06355 [Bacteroidales bacterium]|jgi:hypothetical protein|nr:hypothetical protein [Bacteroidales bacterium]
MKQILFFIFLINFQLVNAQQPAFDPKTFDYSKADSIALNFPKEKYKTYTEIVYPLTKDLQTDHEKFRVLFRWITDNIAYSYGNRTMDANKVVRNKKAVCAGYASLLKEMSNSAGIKCEIIEGCAKTRVYDIGRKQKKSNHAWNAVNLYGKWYLVDATWASGYYDKGKFLKVFKEQHYLTSPKILIKSHFPEKKSWQLLDKPIGKAKFSRQPLYYYGYNLDIQPNKGTIKIQLQDTLEFQFKIDSGIKNATIELANGKFVFYPKVVIKDNTYIVKQKFEKSGEFELTLFLNNEAAVAYKLEIKK